MSDRWAETIVVLVLQFFTIGIRITVMAVGFLGDWFLLMLTYLAVTGIMTPAVAAESLNRNPVDVLAAWPIEWLFGAMLAYAVITLILHYAFYRRVTTYDRFLYALRVAFMTLITVLAIVSVCKLALTGSQFVSSGDELWISLIGVGTFALGAWTFMTLAYLLPVHISFPQSESPVSAVLLQEAYSILIKRKPDFAIVPKAPKRGVGQTFRRRFVRPRHSRHKY